MTSTGLPSPRSDWALFLDFDGTLVEIAERPDAVRAEHRLAGVLEQVSAGLGGALAIVSGRPLAEIDQHLAPARLPGAGLHGLELRASSDGEIARPDGAVPVAIRNALEAFAAENGLVLEDKGIAVALHYRARPDLAEAAGMAVARAVDGHPGLHVLAGKMVFEVKPDGADKGAAVRTFMAGPPFSGRIPVFIGDDVTDEDGFAAAAELGGFGVKIGSGDSLARYRVSSVPAFLDWLDGLGTELVRRKQGDFSG